MYKSNHNLFTILLVIIVGIASLKAQVKIGNDARTISPYSLLELESEELGLLLPRMTTSQRDLAFDANAPVGLTIFNVDTQAIEYYFEVLDPSGKGTGEKNWTTIKKDKALTVGSYPLNPIAGSMHWDPVNQILSVYTDVNNGWTPINQNTITPLGDTSSPTLYLSTNLLGIEGGNQIDLNPVIESYFNTNKDSLISPPQQLNLLGNTLSISDGNSVTLPVSGGGSSPQNLGLVGNQLSISGGNTITLPSSMTGSTTLSYDTLSATSSRSTIEVNFVDNISLIASGTLSFSTTDSKTLVLTATDASSTDTQTLAFDNTTATATQTAISLDNSQALTLITSGTLTLSNTDSTTLSLIGKEGSKIVDADTDTKIQVEEGADDDTIRFDTAGTERMLIDDLGNVGIGTSSPSKKLDVRGEAFLGIMPGYAQQGKLTLGRAGNETVRFHEIRVSNYQVASGNWMRFNIHDATTASSTITPLTLVGTGNVGIGTNSPGQTLTVSGTAQITGALYDSSGDAGTNGQVLSSTSTGTNWVDLSVGNIADTDGDTQIQVEEGSDDDTIRFDTAGTERAVITATGRVGIGTSSPDQKLSVNGNASKVGGGSWASFSDRRVKENIRSYNKGLAEILQIKPVLFNYNEKSGYDKELLQKDYVGIIAQEIEKVLPNTVSEFDDSKNSGLSDKKQFDSSEIIWTLVNAVKELNSKNERFKNENERLKSVLETLVKRVEQLEKK